MSVSQRQTGSSSSSQNETRTSEQDSAPVSPSPSISSSPAAAAAAVSSRRSSGDGSQYSKVNNGHVAVEPTKSRFRWVTLALIFGASILLLVTIYSTFPKLEPDEREKIKLPRNIEDAKVLGSILSRYKDKYYFEVLSGVLVVYIFLQTFAIPGSIFLSILSGFLFNFWVALPLVCFCSATGASCCYALSWLVGRRLIYKYFPERVQSWSVTVERHRDNLLNYIVFLRVTPFLPNWFINITSPVLGVPIMPFFVGTFVGVAPPSFVAIQAGTTLNMLTSSSDAVSWTSLILLIVLGGVSLIPVLLKHRLKEKFDKTD